MDATPPVYDRRKNRNYRFRVEDSTTVLKQIVPGDDYAEYGIGDLSEIDIVTRIEHPHILHASQLKVEPDGVTLTLPLADRSLMDWMQDPFLTTDAKLPIVYKLARGLEFLHRNQILHLDIRPSSVVIQSRTHPLWIELGSAVVVDDISIGKKIDRSIGEYFPAPEIVAGSQRYNAAVDVWTFGMMMLHFISGKASCSGNELDQLLIGIRPQYRTRCQEFFRRILKVNPLERPTMQQICEDSLFEGLSTTISEKVIVPSISSDYSPEHRDTLKLIVHWAGLIYPTASVEVLFLAIDLFNRTGSFYKDRSSDQRIILAATCLWMAPKLTQATELPLSKYIPTIHQLAPTVTAALILSTELEIIKLSNGILHVSKLYRGCKTMETITLGFRNLIMARDSTLYAQTDVDAWLATLTTADSAETKVIPIAELLKL